MKTQTAKGEVVGNQLIFSGGDASSECQYSVLGVMLWCADMLEPCASGKFKILDYNSEIVPPEVFCEVQAELRAIMQRYETRVLGP